MFNSIVWISKDGIEKSTHSIVWKHKGRGQYGKNFSLFILIPSNSAQIGWKKNKVIRWNGMGTIQ